ncbi:hypothetical protein WJX77_008774 [Trebouxia sp. C0004]
MCAFCRLKLQRLLQGWHDKDGLGQHAQPAAHLKPQRVHRTRKSCITRAAEDGVEGLELGLAPAKPRSPVGQMVTYYLKMEPHLFKDALDEQFRRLKDEKDEAERLAKQQQEEQKEKQVQDKGKASSGEVVLYQRMQEVRSSEQRATVEDLMYASVLEKFMNLKVEMMPRMDSIVENQTNLKTLTEGIHSKEALELVREHVLGVMGPASMAYSNTMIKMAKLQAAQVYAASIMFGYFVRRVDKRFQLERQLGLRDDEQKDAVARLERMFNTADEEQQDRPATPSSPSSPSTSGASESSAGQSSGGSQGEGAGLGQGKKKESPLRKYIESFDQATLADMTRQVSQEGAALVDVQTTALFGNLRELQSQMQNAVGQDATSIEDLMQKVQDAVARDAVESLNITVGTQRRAVLEAIAFGTFLRDVESYVDGEYQLLTPAHSSPSKGGPGRGPMRPPLTGV